LDPADPVRLGAYAAELSDLIEAIDRSAPPQVDGGEGLATTMMLEAAEISARTRQAVTLPLA
jgi:predicted dehydrogenase